MLKIRLQRVGKKHEPVFRVVVGDSKNAAKSGKFIEVLGSYDPRSKNQNTLNKVRVQEWISKGAQVSDTVHNLLVSEQVIDKKKINALPKKTAPKKEAPVEETPVVEATEEVVEATEAQVEDAKEEAPSETVETPAEEPVQEAEAPTEETKTE